MKTHYELLSVTPTASADDIKKAFRREIARYHPDKVQHLGQEFQAMAASIAANLTEAYRILMDPDARASYDGGMATGDAPVRPDPPPPPAARPDAATSPPCAATTAGLDFVRRATMSRLREAVQRMPEAVPAPVPGFDGGYVFEGKKGFFKKAEPGVRLLIRIVPQVDPPAVAEAWPLALKAGAPGAMSTLLLMGSGLAPAPDLAAAVTEQRRRSRGGGPVLVPVDVRDWEALFPPETPEPVRALLRALHAAR